MKEVIVGAAIAAALCAMMTFSSFAAKPMKEARQTYRAEATEIREETKALRGELKAINEEIKAIRTNFREVRKSYQAAKTLPEGVSPEEWQQTKELRKQIKAINQAAKGLPVEEVIAAADEAAEDAALDEEINEDAAEEISEAVEETVVELKPADLAKMRDYDGALEILNARQAKVKQKIERRTQILAIWKQIDEIIKH